MTDEIQRKFPVWKVKRTVPTAYVSSDGQYIVKLRTMTPKWYSYGGECGFISISESAEQAKAECERVAEQALDWLVTETMATEFESECGGYSATYEIAPYGYAIWKGWCKDGFCIVEPRLEVVLHELNRTAGCAEFSRRNDEALYGEQ